MAVFNFNEVDEVTETTDDPRRPIPRIQVPGRERTVLESALIHTVALALLFMVHPAEIRPPEVQKPAERRAFLLPPQLSKPPAPKVAMARPAPTPPPPAPIATPPPPPPKSEKISIGEASDQRARELMLERDRDIGRRGAKVAQAEAEPEKAMSETDRRDSQGRGEDAQRAGLPLPTGGSLSFPRGDDSRAQGPSGGLLSASARSVERAMREKRESTQVEIAGHQMGPLFFDPEGADFTRWINHFKSEVYRNWIIPEPARLGVRGQVSLEFVVDRSGRMVRVAMLSSAGMPALDRAASNALQGSDLLPLPDDYPSASVTMRVTFVY